MARRVVLISIPVLQRRLRTVVKSRRDNTPLKQKYIVFHACPAFQSRNRVSACYPFIVWFWHSTRSALTTDTTTTYSTCHRPVSRLITVNSITDAKYITMVIIFEELRVKLYFTREWIRRETFDNNDGIRDRKRFYRPKTAIEKVASQQITDLHYGVGTTRQDHTWQGRIWARRCGQKRNGKAGGVKGKIVDYDTYINCLLGHRLALLERVIEREDLLVG